MFNDHQYRRIHTTHMYTYARYMRGKETKSSPFATLCLLCCSCYYLLLSLHQHTEHFFCSMCAGYSGTWSRRKDYGKVEKKQEEWPHIRATNNTFNYPAAPFKSYNLHIPFSYCFTYKVTRRSFYS